MTTPGILRRVGLAVLALAGLLVGHDAVFRLVAPPDLVRSHLLHETGHGDWSPTRLVAIAGVVALVALGAPARRRVDPARLGRAYLRVVLRLSLVQSTGFVLLEAGERLGHGHALHDVFAHDPVLVAGTIGQLGVGFLGGLLLVAAQRWLVDLRPPQVVTPPAPHRPRPRPPTDLPFPRCPIVAPVGPRAPPVA